MYTVYFTYNKLNPSKCYVGMTSRNIPNYKGSGQYIKYALKKYGEENFARVDLGTFKDKDECHYWEGFYVKTLKTEVKYGGYNISPLGGMKGKGSMSEDTKQRLRSSLLGKMSGEKNGRYGKPSWNKGKKTDEETKNKMKHPHILSDKIHKPKSEVHKQNMKKTYAKNKELGIYCTQGERNGMYGKKHSSETRKKMSESQKKRYQNAE